MSLLEGNEEEVKESRNQNRNSRGTINWYKVLLAQIKAEIIHIK